MRSLVRPSVLSDCLKSLRSRRFVIFGPPLTAKSCSLIRSAFKASRNFALGRLNF